MRAYNQRDDSAVLASPNCHADSRDKPHRPPVLPTNAHGLYVTGSTQPFSGRSQRICTVRGFGTLLAFLGGVSD
jgi:hypothetical protein